MMEKLVPVFFTVVSGSASWDLAEEARFLNQPHPEYLDDKKYPQHYGSLKEEHVDDCVRPVRSEYRKFTPEFAEELHRTTVQRMAENIKMSYNEILKKQVRR